MAIYNVVSRLYFTVGDCTVQIEARDQEELERKLCELRENPTSEMIGIAKIDSKVEEVEILAVEQCLETSSVSEKEEGGL